MLESATDRPARTDIRGRAHIAELVTDFYGRAFRDDLLGPVFVDVARMDLTTHLPVICDFWQTVLFRVGRYRRNALQPHLRLDEQAHLAPAHFARWLDLWCATVDERHAGTKADLAKLQAARIAGAMSRRITGQPPTGRTPSAARHPDTTVRVGPAACTAPATAADLSAPHESSPCDAG